MVLRHLVLLAPPQAGGDHGEEAGRLLAFVLEMMGQVGVEGDAVALAQARGGCRRRPAPGCRRGRPRSRGCPARASAGRRGRRWSRPAPGCAGRRRRAGRAAAASAPRSGGRRARSARRSPARLTATCSPSSRRSSCESVSSSPAAIFAATARVGLVSPRSTCESIGALTPERSARSRSERPIASRRARMRGPTVGRGGLGGVGGSDLGRACGRASWRSSSLYVITDVCICGR